MVRCAHWIVGLRPLVRIDAIAQIRTFEKLYESCPTRHLAGRKQPVYYHAQVLISARVGRE